MKKFVPYLFSTVILVAFPLFAHAQSISDLLTRMKGWLGTITPIVSGLALLAFFWGLARFIYGQANGQEKLVEAGRKLMLWGVIALFIMFSIWGIISVLIVDILGAGTNQQSLTPPCLNGLTGCP